MLRTGQGHLGEELPITKEFKIMKILIATAFSALLLGTALTPAIADDQPSTGPAQHRMGDEGKLPATNNVTTQVPEQGAGTEKAVAPPAHTGWAIRGHFLRPVIRALEFPSRAPVLKIPNSMRRHIVDVISWNVQSAISYRRLHVTRFGTGISSLGFLSSLTR